MVLFAGTVGMIDFIFPAFIYLGFPDFYATLLTRLCDALFYVPFAIPFLRALDHTSYFDFAFDVFTIFFSLFFLSFFFWFVVCSLFSMENMFFLFLLFALCLFLFVCHILFSHTFFRNTRTKQENKKNKKLQNRCMITMFQQIRAKLKSIVGNNTKVQRIKIFKF